MRQFEYAVKLTPAREGGFVVSCRDLPEVVTQGEDVQDALEQAGDAMAEAFAARIDGELDFPKPSVPRRREHRVSPPAEMVAKAALFVAMQEAGLSKSELARNGLVTVVVSVPEAGIDIAHHRTPLRKTFRVFELWLYDVDSRPVNITE